MAQGQSSDRNEIGFFDSCDQQQQQLSFSVTLLATGVFDRTRT